MDQRIRDLELRAAKGDLQALAALQAAQRRLIPPPPPPPKFTRLERPFYIPNTPIPSVKTLERITSKARYFDQHKAALVLRRLLEGKIDPTDFESASKMERQSYLQSAITLIMEAANELLAGHGVEGIRVDGEFGEDSYIDYVNFGDSYVETLCNLPDGRFVVASWGDLVEAYGSDED